MANAEMNNFSVEMSKLFNNYYRDNPFVGSNIASFDEWYGNFTSVTPFYHKMEYEDGRYIVFDEITKQDMTYDTFDDKGVQIKRYLTPQMARMMYWTYGHELFVKGRIYKKTKQGPELEKEISYALGVVPIMIGSKHSIHSKAHFIGTGMSPEQANKELIDIGEDVYDFGGYFIVGGQERVIIFQEQMINNRIYIMNEKKQATQNTKYNINGVKINGVVCRIIAMYDGRSVNTQIGLDKKTRTVIRIQFQSMASNFLKESYKSVDVLRIFRVLGMGNPEDIKNQIGKFIKSEIREKCLAYLEASFARFTLLNNDHIVFSKKFGMGTDNIDVTLVTNGIDELLNNNLFPFVNDITNNSSSGYTAEEKIQRTYLAKVNMLSIMIAQMLEYLAGERSLTKRDGWDVKKTLSPGELMKKLMRQIWNKLFNTTSNVPPENANFFLTEGTNLNSNITTTFRGAFLTGRWGLKKTSNNNYTQPLNRDTSLATINHIMTIDVQIQRTDNQNSIREIQNSQSFFVCPVYSGEGDTVGLVKNFAISTKITSGSVEDEKLIFRYLLGDSFLPVNDLISPESDDNYDTKILINGKYVGWGRGDAVRQYLVILRRRGKIGKETSIFTENQTTIIETTASRIVRPIVILDYKSSAENIESFLKGGTAELELLEESPKYKLIKQYNAGKIKFEELERRGVIEYISPAEQEYLKTAMKIEDIVERKAKYEKVIRKYKVYLDVYNEIKRGDYIRTGENGNVIVEKNKYLYKGLRYASAIYSQTEEWQKEYDEIVIDGYTPKTIDEEVDLEKKARIMEQFNNTKIFEVSFNQRSSIPQWIKEFRETKTIDLSGYPQFKKNDTVTVEQFETLVQKKQQKYLTFNEVVQPFTHIELDPVNMLGYGASVNPLPEHNQAPRNTTQANMSKQALGRYHSNHINRIDKKNKTMDAPVAPVLSTDTSVMFGMSEKGYGGLPTIAFLAYPNTDEDAFIFKKEAIERGLFRYHKNIVYEGSGKEVKSTFLYENPMKYIPDIVKDKERAEKYSKIEDNGLPKLGVYLSNNDCVIGRVNPRTDAANKEGPQYSNESMHLKVTESGIVDLIYNGRSEHTTSTRTAVKLRKMRMPKVGDKLAPRMAQKSTIALIEPEINLPFSQDTGISPDIIVNTHQIPSRMTMSYVIELFLTKAAAADGKKVDGTAFRQTFNRTKEYCYELLEQMQKKIDASYGDDERGALADNNYIRMGSERMMSLNGNPYTREVYMGPVFFQQLKHQVDDKIQSRNAGKVKPSTKQANRGRGNGGGIRFGEMEGATAIAHGCTSFLLERLLYVSDAYETVFCRKCGMLAIEIADIKEQQQGGRNNYQQKYEYVCQTCNTDKIDDFGTMTIPYALKYLMNLLAVAGINLHFELQTIDEYKKNPESGKNEDYAIGEDEFNGFDGADETI